MKFNQVYFVIGTAYAGKSTLVKGLAQKYSGIACEENYHNALLPDLNPHQFPNLTYTRDLEDWHDFVRRSPDEYEAWIHGVSKECEILELQILQELLPSDRPIFVDTNISMDTLRNISDNRHILVMLADPLISVNRFFQRPDREKQFLYRLLLDEPDPDKALENFRQCLARINSRENYQAFLTSGFPVLFRDEDRSPEQTLALAASIFGLEEIP